jgi:cytochrome b
MTETRVWDLPARVVHWSLSVLIVTSWWTAENGNLQLHRYSGYAALGLLVFRLYWAFAGSATSKLFGYLKGARTVIAYLRQLPVRANGVREAGHNPLGAWSAAILFALLLTQVALGLFAVDVDGIESGPLSHLVSFESGRVAADLHADVFDAIVAFSALHVAAVLFYLVYRRENLITPMLTGMRQGAAAEGAASAVASWRRAVVGVALAALATWAVSAGFWT